MILPTISVLIIATLLFPAAKADQCIMGDTVGLCMPGRVCKASGRDPASSPSCPRVTQCCPGYRASACKMSDGRKGHCLSEKLCGTGGGISPQKSNCGGPGFIKCCVYKKERPKLGFRCLSPRGTGFCIPRFVCWILMDHKRFFYGRGCGAGSGCCV